MFILLYNVPTIRLVKETPMPSRPNLLIVYTDQMRGMDMRCAGNTDMITPNLDRLAAEGVRCTHGLATTPICSPNRATLLTGTYPTRHGLMFNDTTWNSELPTLGTVARDAGYRTGYIGKWHIDGMPREKFTPPGHRRAGFDDFWAVHNCNHEYFMPMFYRDSPEMIRVPGYEPEVQTGLAEEFLDGDDGRPFCLVLSWGAPHNPYERVPDQYRLMYDPDSLRLRQNGMIIPRESLDPAWSHRPTTADYYALITSMDDLLGRLLARLEADGQADNTIIVFTSDHGDMMWSQGLLYKCVPYEESVNVPLIVRWPAGLPKGQVCETLVNTPDLLPTLAGLMGLEVPETVQGLDLSAALQGRPDAPRPTSAFLSFYSPYVFRKDKPTPPWRGVRTERYTYAETCDRRPWLFFDNERDPYQFTNLVGVPEYQTVADELHTELDGWLQRLDDPFLPHQEMKAQFATPYRWPEEPELEKVPVY